MTKKEEGMTVMKLKVSDRTKELLIELAGSPRKVGEYLDELVPSVHEAQERITRAKREAQQRQLAISLLESQGNE